MCAYTCALSRTHGQGNLGAHSFLSVINFRSLANYFSLRDNDLREMCLGPTPARREEWMPQIVFRLFYWQGPT